MSGGNFNDNLGASVAVLESPLYSSVVLDNSDQTIVLSAGKWIVKLVGESTASVLINRGAAPAAMGVDSTPVAGACVTPSSPEMVEGSTTLHLKGSAGTVIVTLVA